MAVMVELAVTRTCKRCERTLPLSSFPTIGTIQYRSVLCMRCFGATRVQEPDSRPAIRLRTALARRRRQGLPWDDRVYDELIRAVLRGIRQDDREFWPAIFRAHRGRWRAAYERTGAITPLTLDLIDG